MTQHNGEVDSGSNCLTARKDLSKPDRVQSIIWSVDWANVAQTTCLCANRDHLLESMVLITVSTVPPQSSRPMNMQQHWAILANTLRARTGSSKFWHTWSCPLEHFAAELTCGVTVEACLVLVLVDLRLAEAAWQHQSSVDHLNPCQLGLASVQKGGLFRMFHHREQWSKNQRDLKTLFVARHGLKLSLFRFCST